MPTPAVQTQEPLRLFEGGRSATWNSEYDADL